MRIFENIGGEWLAGSVSGTFYERGLGRRGGLPGNCAPPLTPPRRRLSVYLG